MYFTHVMKLFLFEFSVIFSYIYNQIFYNTFHIIHASQNVIELLIHNIYIYIYAHIYIVEKV